MRLQLIEQLESRQLLSGVNFDPDTETITVGGTVGNDIVVVQPAPSNQITIVFNGIAQTFPTGMFTQTDIALLAGNDTISIDALVASYFSVDAADGSDAITIVGRESVHDEIDVSGNLIALNGRHMELAGIDSVVIDSLGGPDLISFFDLGLNPLKSITVLAGDGDDGIQFFDDDPLSGATINLYGQAGNDYIFWGDNNSLSGRSFFATQGVLNIDGIGTIHHDAETENFILLGGMLTDTFHIRPSNTTKYAIDAGGWLSTSAPDTLLVQKSGSTNIAINFSSPGAGSVTSINRQPITFTRTETVRLVSSIGSPMLAEKLEPICLASELVG